MEGLMGEVAESANTTSAGEGAVSARKRDFKVELTESERAASLHSLPKLDDERVCYGYQTVNGCKVNDCSFPHRELPADVIARLGPEAQLLAAVRGGFKLGKHVSPREEAAEVAALRAQMN